jgi:ubiquinone/menaquinone biosynthesis C-methylase UbiE/uncharacterized protein YbaR (Trm112 family)
MLRDMIRKSRLSLDATAWFKAGKNVIETGRAAAGISQQDLVEIAYDLQAGSYTEAMKEPAMLSLKRGWGSGLAKILAGLGVTSACEAGIGEASTLAFAAAACPASVAFSGFDISLSRLLYARGFLGEHRRNANLFCAGILDVPLPDSSVDAVVTNHGIEPNGGSEEPILRELLRVAARYLVLIEPDYESGSPEQKERMARHNYVRNLAGHLEKLPGKILRHEPWPFFTNPLNKPSLTVFEKRGGAAARDFAFVSPVNKKKLEKFDGFLFCREEGLLYPVAFGIPVLKDDCAIMCSHADMAAR